MWNLDYKKYFLRSFIIGLTISALIGIFVFLFGDFEERELRLLWTTLAFGAYSLTGLCSAAIIYRDNIRTFSMIGMLLSIFAFLTSAFIIWEIIVFEETWKAMAIFAILAVGMGEISLLLLNKPKTKNIKYSMSITLMLIILVTFMCINSTINEFNESEFYYRLLGVFIILMVLGTIAIPILNLITKKKHRKLS